MEKADKALAVIIAIAAVSFSLLVLTGCSSFGANASGSGTTDIRANVPEGVSMTITVEKKKGAAQ